MSTSSMDRQSPVLKQHARAAVRSALQWHLPVGQLTRPVFALLYQMHVAARAGIGWSARFFWYEPLFRSQCRWVGDQFVMEQLPYIVGRGEILIGDRVRFSGKPSFAFSSRTCPSPKLLIGDDCFLGHNTAITVARSVSIGNHCLIAGGVRISDFDGHPIDARRRRAAEPADPESVRSVKLGNDVWVGHSAMILKGVQVGDRAVIGARSVVTHDVPPDTVVGGNPARMIRSLKAA